MKLRAASVVLGFLSLAQLSFAQSTAETASALPRLVRFGGTVKDFNGNPLTGVVGITFALYSEQTGSAALWLETQNVTADGTGRYVALLGSTKPDGLPTELFITEQARWVGVQVSGQAEQPRVLLLSVPYAMKAADAETLGGKPASAYLLNPQPREGVPASAQSNPAAASKASNTDKSVVPATITGGGTKNYIPLWTSNSNLGNSIVYQSTTGLGIGTTSPLATLDIRKATGMRAIASGNGIAIFGNATVTSGTGKGVEGDTNSTSGTGVAGTANATTGSTQGMWGSSFSTSGVGVIGEAYATSGSTIGVEGISASSTGTAGVFNNTGGGKILSGQTNGTEVFSVNATGSVFTGNQTVNGNLSATGVVTGSSFQIGSNLFAFGSYANQNAFLGFAGNTTTTGIENTASGAGALYSNTYANYNSAYGFNALYSNTAGYGNTANGAVALFSNSTGYENTASGAGALYSNTSGNYNSAYGFNALFSNTTGTENTATGSFALYFTTGSGNTATGDGALNYDTTGSYNTANGYGALLKNTTGSYNAALGYLAGPDSTTPALTNSTAVGAYADVLQSNSLVLGSTAAQNGSANVSVGIDVGNPSNILTVLQGGGAAIADGWSVYSSRRWKTNIQTLHGALEKVVQLRGVSYNLKETGKHEVGVIAEEVGAVVPEVVSYEENGKDARGVDYSRLTALLIEATKEQQALIREQQEQIARLTRQVKAIQATLKANGPSGSEVRTVKAEGTTARK